MNINTISISTGKFAINITGSITDSKVQDLATKGLVSEVYRKVFPKSELAMAKHEGKTTVKEDGKVVVDKDFKRASVEFVPGLATEIENILRDGIAGFGTLTVSVTKYEPATAQNQAEKVLAAKLAGLELAKEFMTEEQYAAKVAELTGGKEWVGPIQAGPEYKA